MSGSGGRAAAVAGAAVRDPARPTCPAGRAPHPPAAPAPRPRPSSSLRPSPSRMEWPRRAPCRLEGCRMGFSASLFVWSTYLARQRVCLSV